tara:strand:- start:12236 stop:12469 length:234 start_codon:yes stop_codon:yes gene_type:complete
MIEWFVVAMVYFKDTDIVEIKKMEMPFQTEQLCKAYLRNTPNIVYDIQKLEPNSVGASFKCFDTNGVKQFLINRRSI